MRMRPDAKSILVKAGSQSGRRGDASLYGLGPGSVRNSLCSGILMGLPRLLLGEIRSRLGCIRQLATCPIGPLQRCDRNSHGQRSESTSSISMRSLRRRDLRRPLAFCPADKRHLVNGFRHRGPSVSADGYFYVQHGALQPQELNGALIRIREASVGDYDGTFLDFPTSIGAVFQRWISRRFGASDELEDALNIDRRTLRAAHPAYVELRTAVHGHLHRVIARARAELYGSEAQSRRELKAEHVATEICRVAAEAIKPVDPAAAEEIVAAWKWVHTRETRRSVLRSYSVADLYRVIVLVANDVFDPRPSAGVSLRVDATGLKK